MPSMHISAVKANRMHDMGPRIWTGSVSAAPDADIRVKVTLVQDKSTGQYQGAW